MKKLFILILLVLILLINGLMVNNEFSLSNYFNGKITLYASAKNNEIFNNVSITNCKENLIGESMQFSNLEVGNAIKTLKAEIKFVEYIDNLTIIYCYTNLINKTVKLKSHKINLQICIADEYQVIGWPMILGAF